MTIIGTYKNDLAFDGTRSKTMMRVTTKQSASKLSGLVKRNIVPISKSGKLYRSVKTTGVQKEAPSVYSAKIYSDCSYAPAVEYGYARHWVAPKHKKVMHWTEFNTGESGFSTGHYIGPFSGHHMFQRAAAEFERLYARDIAERNAHIFLNTVDVGRRSYVI